jgi:hypothetical protein
MLISFVMRSILLGLIWEVFAVVNEDEDYLVKSIHVDKEFKHALEDIEDSNPR